MAWSLKDCPSPEETAATTVGSVSCVAAVDDGSSSVTSSFICSAFPGRPNPGTSACLTPSGQDGPQPAAKIATRKPGGESMVLSPAESRRHWECLKFGIVARFGLGGRHVSDWSKQATVVEPLDPFQGGELDKFQRTPRSPSADHLGLVKAVDALGQSIVIAVADAAHGGLDARFGQALGVANRHVLHSPVAMVNQAATLDGAAVSQSLLQGIQHEARLCRTTHPPADDAPGIGVDNKSDVDEALPGRDVCEVRQPQYIRPRRPELPVHPVERTGDGRVADRGTDLAASHCTFQAHLPHQPGHSAACGANALAAELPPHLAHAVDAEVCLEHPPDLGGQHQVAPRSRWQLGRVGAPGSVRAVGGWGDRQHAADRLDPICPTMIVDEGDHRLNGRSSSAWAKYADALRQDLIGLAQFPVLALQRLDPIAVMRCGTGPQTLVALGPPHPAAQRLSRAADLASNRVDRRPLRRMFRLVVKYHAHGAITHLS